MFYSFKSSNEIKKMNNLFNEIKITAPVTAIKNILYNSDQKQKGEGRSDKISDYITEKDHQKKKPEGELK